jgi:hypothetical protein
MVEYLMTGQYRKYFWGNQMEGEKKEGRPKLRWLDSVANDMKSIGVKEIEEESRRRTSWAIILKEGLLKL